MCGGGAGGRGFRPLQDDCAGGSGLWQPEGPGNLDLHRGCATDCFFACKDPMSLMHFGFIWVFFFFLLQSFAAFPGVSCSVPTSVE